MVKRRLIVLGIMAAAIVAGGLALVTCLGNEPRAGQVAIVRRGTIEATIDALGRVRAAQGCDIVPRVGGQIIALMAREGDTVERGQPLLLLDEQEYGPAAEQAQRTVEMRREQLETALQAPSASAIAQARARLRWATALRQNARQDYDEIADQPDAESSDEALDLESAKLEYELAHAEFDRVMEGPIEGDLLRLRADLAAAEQALTEARRRLELTHIDSPMAGTLTQFDLSPGDMAVAHSALGRVDDLAVFQVHAEVDEIDVPHVQIGQRVRVRLDAFPSHELTGTIAYLPPTLDESRGGATYEALIDLDHGGLPLRPGMGANLTIILDSEEGALLVPRRAVRQIGRHEVVRVLDGRREEQVIVRTGLSNSVDVQILSGLSQGQTVLID